MLDAREAVGSIETSGFGSLAVRGLALIHCLHYR